MLQRLVIMAGMLTIPFGILAILTGKAEGIIWLMIPFVLMIPVLFVCAMIFGFFEKLSASFGLPAGVVVPLVGSILGGLVVFLASQVRTSTLAQDIRAGSLEAIASVIGIILAGAVVGIVWRLTPRISEYFGWGQ
jgi:hypothetical protein